MKPKASIAIIGLGVVGKAQALLFREAALTVFDPDPAARAFLDLNRLQGRLATKVEECGSSEAVFICVPTPMKPDGSCDISLVEESIERGTRGHQLVVICSTIAPGTLQYLDEKFPGRFFVFEPEYIGETTAHPLRNQTERIFLILGGRREACDKAVQLYQSVYNSTIKILITSGIEAEVIKYMENTAIATQVTLANEFYNICQLFGADYNVVREGFLLDPRMSRYFTFVYPENRGFSGKCLPKDLNAVYQAALRRGYRAEFVKAVLENNERIRKTTKSS